MPRFGHLPYVMGEGNKKLSKRDPQASLNLYRERGLPARGPAQLPRAARLVGRRGPRVLLAPRAGRRSSTSSRVNPTRPASTRRSAIAINGDWVRHIGADDLAARLVPYLQAAGADPGTPTAEQQATICRRRARSCRSGWRRSRRVRHAAASCFVPEEAFEVDREDRERVPRPRRRARPAGGVRRARGCSSRRTRATIEAALRAALVDGLGLKPKVAFGPVRVAVTGRRISPPLFESIELLGRERTLRAARGRACPDPDAEGPVTAR